MLMSMPASLGADDACVTVPARPKGCRRRGPNRRHRVRCCVPGAPREAAPASMRTRQIRFGSVMIWPGLSSRPSLNRTLMCRRRKRHGHWSGCSPAGRRSHPSRARCCPAGLPEQLLGIGRPKVPANGFSRGRSCVKMATTDGRPSRWPPPPGFAAPGSRARWPPGLRRRRGRSRGERGGRDRVLPGGIIGCGADGGGAAITRPTTMPAPSPMASARNTEATTSRCRMVLQVGTGRALCQEPRVRSP